MTTYTVYLDESGTHTASEAVAVAGYIAPPGAWAQFEVEWRAALTDLGVEAFHMAPFSNRAGRYAWWPEEKRRDGLARLIGIVNDRALASVGVVLPVHLYDRLLTGTARERSGGPYGLAAVACAMEVAEILRADEEAVADYVFENGALGRGQLAKVLRDNAGSPEARNWSRIASVRFEDKRRYLPLQAADILAYELYKHLPRHLGLDRARLASTTSGNWPRSPAAGSRLTRKG
jgi:hypothetical protein